MNVTNPTEKLLWSIAFPGFGQFLNGRFMKGITLTILELIVNVQSHFNEIIISSFNGEIEQAISHANYQWLMFYPCLYFFSMWDAWKDAGGGKERYSFLPFVFAAYFVTVGTMYSSTFKVFGITFGPVWLPILSVIPGIAVGYLLMKLLKICVRSKEGTI